MPAQPYCCILKRIAERKAQWHFNACIIRIDIAVGEVPDVYFGIQNIITAKIAAYAHVVAKGKMLARIIPVKQTS